MKTIAIVMLFAVALAGSAFAGDENKKDVSISGSGSSTFKSFSLKKNKHNPPVDLTGVLQFAVWKTRTGEMVITPQDMTALVEAQLTLGPGPFARLYTKETWASYGGMVREMNWVLGIGRDGKVIASFPRHATYYYGPDFTIPSEEDFDTIASHAEMTGCPEYGTWPMVHGHFDGKILDIATEQQGVCTGGTYWGLPPEEGGFGVSEDMGPLHTDVILSLEVTE
jgi:hypothetical protein